MKFFILFFLLVTFVFGVETSCYSVQLTSAFKTQESSDALHSNSYDKTCKVMDIGSNVLVRCGCFEHFKEANTHIKQYTSKYKDAYIVSTYSSRFASQRDMPVAKTIQTSTPPVVAPIAVHKTEVLNEIMPIAVLDVSDIKEVTVKKKKKKSKAKKKKKKKKSKAKKKKKKKKSKARKSKAQKYGYNRYLKKLQNSRASRKYKYKYKFGAQISYDVAYVNEADISYLDSDFRRIRIYHQGSFLNEKLFYELEYSFTGSNKFKDIFLGYKNHSELFDIDYKIKAGNIRIPFSLEDYTSSKNNMFMERSLRHTYAQNRQLGTEILLRKKFNKSDSINLFLSLFTSSLDERLNDEIIKQGYSMRTTYTHKWRKNHLLSVGGAYFAKNLNGDNIKFNESAESYLMQNKYISASIKGAKSLSKNNLELLYIYDNYSLQGEYTQVGVDAINKSTTGELTSYTFNSYYLEGSYFILGQGRRYRATSSRMRKPRLNRDGAVELALRYSYINLNDQDEDNNGQQTDYTLGVNWYINDEIKLMLNYIVAEPMETKLYNGRLHVLQTRMLFAF